MKFDLISFSINYDICCRGDFPNLPIIFDLIMGVMIHSFTNSFIVLIDACAVQKSIEFDVERAKRETSLFSRCYRQADVLHIFGVARNLIPQTPLRHSRKRQTKGSIKMNELVNGNFMRAFN